MRKFKSFENEAQRYEMYELAEKRRRDQLEHLAMLRNYYSNSAKRKLYEKCSKQKYGVPECIAEYERIENQLDKKDDEPSEIIEEARPIFNLNWRKKL